MAVEQAVTLERHDSVLIISLNRPDQRNAVDKRLCAELRAALDTLEHDAALRVGILRGNGRVFCAGMDLKAFSKGDADEILAGEGRFGGLVSRERTKPLVAAVQGAALAGGFELMLACDLVVAAQNTVFGLPEVSVGLVAGAGGAIRLAQRLPRVVANAMLLTGEPITAEQALHFGLINQQVAADELDQASLDLANRIARNAPLSVNASLALASIRNRQAESQLWPENDRVMSQIGTTQDAREGAQAFAEKRKPRWQGC